MKCDLHPSAFILHPLSLAGTTRLELANQLIEGQPAFHFAFIPKGSSDLRLQISDLFVISVNESAIGNLEIGNHSSKQ
jgi:hypothetical protein